MQVRLVCILAVCLAALAPCMAQEAEGPQPDSYSLPELLQMALDQRPNLEASRLSVESAEARTRGQKSRRWPALSANWNARTNKSLDRPVSVGGGVTQVIGDRTTTREASAGLDWTFWDNTRRPSIRHAEASEKASRYRLSDTRRSVLEQVALLYHTALGNRRLADVAMQGVAASQRHLDLVNAQIDAGLAADSDRLPVEVELTRARARATRAEKAYMQSIADLRAAVGMEQRQDLRLAEPPDPPSVEGQVEGFITEALENRDDLNASRQQLEGARWSARLADIQNGVQISTSGHMEYGRYTGLSGESWSVQAGLSVPLYDGGSRADEDVAELNVEAAEADLAQLRINVRQDVESSYLGVTESATQIDETEAAVESAQVALDVAEERYAAEVADIIEVTDAEQSLREAQADYVQAIYDYNSSRVRLFSAAGRDLLQVLGDTQ